MLQIGRSISLERLRHEHAHLILVMVILGVLASGDHLRKPCRSLEEKNKTSSSNASPAVEAICGVAAPLIEDKPNTLFGNEIRMPAVSPNTRSVETTVKVSFLIASRHLPSFLIMVLGVVIGWLHIVRE